MDICAARQKRDDLVRLVVRRVGLTRSGEAGATYLRISARKDGKHCHGEKSHGHLWVTSMTRRPWIWVSL
jgi:hypothetical protein